MITSTTVPASAEAASTDDKASLIAELNALVEECRTYEATRDLNAPEVVDDEQVEKLLAGLDGQPDEAVKPEVVEPCGGPDFEGEVVALLDAVDNAEASQPPHPPVEDEFATLAPHGANAEPTSVDDVLTDGFEVMPSHLVRNPRAGRGILARVAGVTDGIVTGGIMVAGRRYEWARNLTGQTDKNTAEGALGINRRTFARKIKDGVPFADALAQSQEANRRYARTVVLAGKEMRLSDFADAVGLSLRTVQLYTKQGMTGDEIAGREKKKPGPKKKV